MRQLGSNMLPRNIQQARLLPYQHFPTRGGRERLRFVTIKFKGEWRSQGFQLLRSQLSCLK
jgi:hypothetical protein